ncbi:uncharacterized protein BX664DRAFT_323720 [Halteromyces radiatus]|uniref:uncharacterized protein n=1 Tax=Halteromyces radiatus TaxID=101107 RepID=UPI002220EE69|nr:uncharacterized protein BX664DRAFT_323720 [Halteromyces radiatus]KAI8096346.1 hypothetical protein BX664DRAFT_323720 [Halteromyces radiatus]
MMMEKLVSGHESKVTNTDNDCPRFRPFASLPNLRLKVRKAKYSTSLDPRGYIPVYEYIINSQPIMWDRETGYVHFTGIWKALGNSKSDIVKMVDSNPELKVKKIRGGFLKIQGTWIPYDFAAILCRRTAWNIRKELTAIFGPRFTNEALNPCHAEYGCLLLDPKNAHVSRGANSRRGSNYTTMRQVRHQPYPLNERSSNKTTIPTSKRSLKPGHSDAVDNVISSMSLSRLLNTDQIQHDTPISSSFPLLDDTFISDHDDMQDDEDSSSTNNGIFTESPHTTPSPTFRGVPSFSDDKWSNRKLMHSDTLLPPITQHNSKQSSSFNSPCEKDMLVRNNDQHHSISVYSTTPHPCPVPRITPITPSSSHWSQSSINMPSTPVGTESPCPDNTTELNQDIIDTINATILLQRLSQDDGARPFRPMSSNTIPSRVVVGDQEYRICWDN